MRVLLTGANGYIGLRLLPELLEQGHEVLVMVRNVERFPVVDFRDWEEDGKVTYYTGDFLLPESLPDLPEIDAAYYFLHSMGASGSFTEQEASCAQSFSRLVTQAGCKQVVYLGGLSVEDKLGLSPHMESRNQVARILSASSFSLTVLRASIIVGSGSASFEIIRDLAEKLPVMITPKWTRTRCQPIAIRNVITYLTGVLGNKDCLDQSFDIGGPEILTYRGLLMRYAEVRGLRRWALPISVLTPRLSSYWLYFMTSTTYPLAQSLVSSLHVESICREDRIRQLLPQDLLRYEEAITKAVSLIAQNRVPSVWYDSLSSGQFSEKNLRSVKVPEHGVFTDRQVSPLHVERERVLQSVWSLGGEKGWPSLNWAWKVRGAVDRLFGGIGVRRGRRHPTHLKVGDALDFWRVVLADKEHGRLILSAEMKLPGEAWLEFTVTEDEIVQKATFRPKGLHGRLYWWVVYPFHLILFPQMVRKIAKGW